MAHACGVVHRDLKPSNVFLSRDPTGQIVPKLIDFGISKWVEGIESEPASTPHGELMGSPMYMSPEAVRGARDLTPQSDQYSLGVILYECVTGRTPFEEDSLLAVLEAVARGQIEPPRQHRPELSSTLEEALLRALHPEPRWRFAGVHELGRALYPCADQRTRLLWMLSFGLVEGDGHADAVPGSIILARAPSSSPPPPAASRRGLRHPALALGALALAGAAYAGWQRLPPTRLTDGAATVRALQPPTASLALPPRKDATGELPVPASTPELTLHPAPRPAAHSLLRSPGDVVGQRSIAPRAVAPRVAPRVAPPSAPGPTRRQSAFGANQSPLLD